MDAETCAVLRLPRRHARVRPDRARLVAAAEASLAAACDWHACDAPATTRVLGGTPRSTSRPAWRACAAHAARWTVRP